MDNMVTANVTLKEVNDAIAILLIPAMVYIGIVMIIGLLGNLLVVYLFPMKMASGTQSMLISCLAVFDLLSCFVSMPVEIADMRFFYTFESAFACKLLRFVNAFCAMCSILTLVLIAVDRYRKVCQPHKTQLSLTQVKAAIVGCVFVAAMFAWPAAVVYGIRSAETRVGGLIGRDCSTSDAVKNTLYPLIYNGVLALLFFFTTGVLCVLYAYVWRTAKRHTAARPTSLAVNNCKEATVTSIELSSAESESGQNKTTNSSTKSRKTSKPSHKTTVIFLLVTVVFVTSFLPYLALVIVRSLVKDLDYKLNDAGTLFYNLFLRSYFVNSAANPIIYGVMNVRFRNECSKLLKRMFCYGQA